MNTIQIDEPHQQDTPRCIRDAISRTLTKKIYTREWPIGHRIPSNEQLAKEFNTSTFTIHKALTPLVEAGLLHRKRRLGTFVASREGVAAAPSRLTTVPADPEQCVGILVHSNLSPSSGGPNLFHQHLLLHVQQRLMAQGVPVRIWTAPFQSAEDPGPLAEIETAVKAGELSGIVVVAASDAALAGLRALGIAHAVAGSYGDPDMITWDLRYFVEQAVGSLVHAGCRRIGVISHLRRPGTEPAAGDRPLTDTAYRFHEGLRRAATFMQAEMREEWQILPEPDFSPFDPGSVGAATPGSSFIQYGYRAFGRLWERDERPDGLLVFPDRAAQGVTMAMLERHVAPPELRVVFHRNVGMELHVPFSATFLDSDLALLADMLLRMMRGELHGPLWLPHQLVGHMGTVSAHPPSPRVATPELAVT